MLWQDRTGEVSKMGATCGDSKRFRDLQALEAVWKGVQYDDRPYTWDGYDKAVLSSGGLATTPEGMPPRCQRIPRAQSGLAKQIVGRFSDLLFGEGRAPKLSVEGDPDSSDWLEAAWDQAELWAIMGQARGFGGGTGTAVVTLWLQDGEYYAEALNPKWCYPAWEDRSQFILSSLDVRYQYPVEVPKDDGKGYEEEWRWYRRIITESEDTVWRDVPVRKGEGVPVSWGQPERTIQHGLGFCPAVWIQNEPMEGQIDGVCDFEGEEETIESYDYVLSDLAGGTMANLDPTLVLRVDRKQVQGGTVKTGSHTALVVGQSGDAKLLELSGSAADAGMKTADKLRSVILEACSCVLIDPEKVTGLGQGRDLMESLYRPMLQRAGTLRMTYGRGIQRLSQMVLDVGRQYHGSTVETDDGTVERLVVRLPDREETDKDGNVTRLPRKLGDGGEIQLTWGAYFPPTADDKQKAATTVGSLRRDPVLISLETAIKFLAGFFPIDDVQAEIEAVRAEQEEAAQRQATAFGFGGGTGGTPGTEGLVAGALADLEGGTLPESEPAAGDTE